MDMWNDCGRTGCAGGGSFLLFVGFFWIVASGFTLFSEPKSVKEYLKSIPSRVLLFAVVTGLFVAIGWVVMKIERFLLG